MISGEKKKIVQERILLINQLIEAKEHFRGWKNVQKLPNNEWTDHWSNYFALRNYLALTCFDILGQTDDWADINKWIKASEKKEEREKIFNIYSDKTNEEAFEGVLSEYNAIYGVRRGFFLFIDSIITSENKLKLLRSIRIQDFKSGEKIENEKKIKDFLFDMRNWFTHQGRFMGEPGGCIFPVDEKDNTCQIFRDKKYSYWVTNWPFVLIKIIEDTIKIE